MNTETTVQDAQANITIQAHGACIDKLIDLKRNSGIGEVGATQLHQTATEIVQDCVDVYSSAFGIGSVGAQGSGLVKVPYSDPNHPIPNEPIGLIYGKVQSGKTNAIIATIAMAIENGFRCFVVLTSDNTWLGKQTAGRFKTELIAGPVVYDWEEWNKDPLKFAASLKDYIDDTGVVLVSTKNVRHLENLITVLRAVKAGRVPSLVIDDEADNASLNTSESKQAKLGKSQVPNSAVFESIGKIRKIIPNHIYLQITATPQSLLLQGLTQPCKPKFCVLSQPGMNYMGGELFFEPDSKYCCVVDEDELIKLRSGLINPGQNWEIPKGLRLALCCFFIGATYKMRSSQGQTESYSFLAHINHKKINHKVLEEIIRAFAVDLDKSLRGKLAESKKKQAQKWLEEAYVELKKTATDLPSLSELTADLEYTLRNAIPDVINADNPHNEPQYRPGMNILIGGNRLGRGVTIKGLTITYYGRDAKQKTMDTVHQHARMFGYRSQLKDITRLFVSQSILYDFRAIYDSDEGMRQAIGDDPAQDIKIKPVWIGRSLKPTRSNVLNPADIGAFAPGREIFPPDPLWKDSEVNKNVDKLNELLEPFKHDKVYHEVDIEFLIRILNYMPSRYMSGYSWEDKRVREALHAMTTDIWGVHKGRLNVRRGAGGAGLDLKRQDPPFNSIADGSWVKTAREEYPHVPTLIVVYEKGEKVNRWDEQPLYLPVLILPQDRFAIMFNYAEKID